VSKEHAYAYEAGYRDGSINYELEHCPACKNVADLQEALAENDRLRELAKKLVILAFARCADCDLFDVSCALVPTQKCLLWNECESIARELGVEVDDG
jgi:hypothetical protein